MTALLIATLVEKDEFQFDGKPAVLLPALPARGVYADLRGIFVQLKEFEKRLKRWCQTKTNVVAAAIVGSHARHEARPDSDLDVIILSKDHRKLLGDNAWLASFGEPSVPLPEGWGAITSLRVQYGNGLEVEFGIGDPSWADLPPDSGTRRVVTDGIRIIYDPCYKLQVLRDCVQRLA